MTSLFYTRPKQIIGRWQGSEEEFSANPAEILKNLRDLSTELIFLDHQDQLGITSGGSLTVSASADHGIPAVASLRPISPAQLGDPGFCERYRDFLQFDSNNGNKHPW